jgi:hypothetical protein
VAIREVLPDPITAGSRVRRLIDGEPRSRGTVIAVHNHLAWVVFHVDPCEVKLTELVIAQD